MNSPDYFTRLIKTNAVHVEANTALRRLIEPVWQCQGCDETHESQRGAKYCCPPLEIFKCPICDGTHAKKEEAESCCGGRGPTQCPVCLRDAKTYFKAVECCLHTHPALDFFARERVAQSAQAGASWLDAIAQNTKH